MLKKVILGMKCLAVIAAVAVISYGVWQLGQINGEYEEADLEYEILAEQYTQDVLIEHPSVSPNDTGEAKYCLSVNFDELQKINPDVVGWIYISDSKVNYPILKSSDNSDYLTKTFEGKENSSGSIFMDCRNMSDFSNDNTIIYGHNMKNGSMFHILNSYAEEAFYKEGRQIIITTKNWQKSFHIISAHTASTSSQCYTLSFENLIDYEAYLKAEAAYSQYETESYEVTKKTITLSTCRGSSGKRFVLLLQED
ncbi:MAG: class B sortase [Lachnospiraceae bacterium]|nr:class B sortase [Lachnospiraceae bacterium]